MTRSPLFDRLNHELESFSKKAQKALDEGRLQVELLRVRRQRDKAARDLGLFVYRREREHEGMREGDVTPPQLEPLLLRLDDLSAEIRRLEQQIAGLRRDVAAEPPPT
jgi:hypothetical protein